MKTHKLEITCLVRCDLPYVTASDGAPVGFAGPNGTEYRPQITWEIGKPDTGDYHDATYDEISALGVDWEYDEIEMFQIRDEEVAP